MLLACVALTDEFWSGVAVVAAPEVEREQSIEHGGYALLVFALPLLGSALLEAGLALVSDRYPRRRVIALGLLGLAAALLVCAFASSGALLAIGLGLAGAASGVACSAAQGELVASAGTAAGAGARAMTRWVLLGSIGDVLTPVLVAAMLGAGGSYRGAFVAAAVLALLQAGWVLESARRHPTATAVSESDSDSDSGTEAGTDPEDADALPLLTALREGVRNGELWRWLIAASLCTFLDEIVVAFAALYAERDLGASPAAAVACVTGVSAGAVIGAWSTDRLLAVAAPDRVLLGSTLATLLALGAVVFAPSLPWLALALVALGASAAPQYALTKAKAYAASPGRPGVVNALAQVFVVVDVVGPLLLGGIADRWGVGMAIACLAVQPLGVSLLLGSRLRVTSLRRGRDSEGSTGVGPQM
ncbi:MAG TPA: MFS transporter [Polyangiaceae bacterium]|nr:MFS transporter [Polyangiaceae bacterium]